MSKPHRVDTLILGAGAAGMMCAAHAGGRSLVVDHAKAPGEKIRISGGGRCNFTNLNTAPDNFLGANPHFCKSALGRYTQWDFLDLVGRHRIAWHEKEAGQLFCDTSARDIIEMLRTEMRTAGADLWLDTSVGTIDHRNNEFCVSLERRGTTVQVTARHLVVATGGKSIPKMGATGLAYRIAETFGLGVVPPRPGLVPLTFGGPVLEQLKQLSGLSVGAAVSCGNQTFRAPLLFTHRGLSGPAILQISSYWGDGDSLGVDLAPDIDLLAELGTERRTRGRRSLPVVLADHLPARLAALICDVSGLEGNLADQSDRNLAILNDHVTRWDLRPTGSEGYRTAEVTLGGVNTNELSSRTLQASAVPGLHFIGECVDVTGWLGGYNFQWAWSSGWAAGTAIAQNR